MSTYSRLIPAFRIVRQIAPLTLALALFAGATGAALAAEPIPAGVPAAAPAPPPPDTVILANGDHLSGSVTQIDGGKLTLHTEYAGDIVIDFTKISSVKLQKAEVLSQMKTQGKHIDISKIEIVGIENQGKQVTVTTAAGATQPAPAPPTVRTPAAAGNRNAAPARARVPVRVPLAPGAAPAAAGARRRLRGAGRGPGRATR